MENVKHIDYQEKQCADCVYKTDAPIGCTEAEYAYFIIGLDGECKVRTVKTATLTL